VRRLIFSPHGKWLATSGLGDQTVKVWNATTGRLLHTFKHPNDVTDVAFSSDGTRLVAGGRTRAKTSPCIVKAWDVATGKEVLNLKFDAHGTSMTRFSPDSKLVAVAGVGHIRVWGAKTGRDLFTANHRVHFGATVFSVSFSPDSRRLVTAGANTEAVIWDTSTGNELMALRHRIRLNCATYSPDGKWVATGTRNGTVMLWDAAKGRSHLTLREHSGDVRVRFTPDGNRLVSTGKDGVIKVWDITGIVAETNEGSKDRKFADEKMEQKTLSK